MTANFAEWTKSMIDIMVAMGGGDLEVQHRCLNNVCHPMPEFSQHWGCGISRPCLQTCLAFPSHRFCSHLLDWTGWLYSQLRIHDSQGVDFYVLVASGPIIEDCCGLRFAPTGLRYPEYQHHLQVPHSSPALL